MGAEKQLYISFFLLGMATLLPWNFFITPYEYWMEKLQRSDWNTNTNGTEQSSATNGSLKEPPSIPDNLTDSCATEQVEHNELQKFWMSLLGVTTMGTNLIFCFLTTILAKKISRNLRFIGCLIGYIICLTMTLVMVKLPSEDWIPEFFTTTLIIVVAITICCAIFQTSTFGLASKFPPEYGIMVAVMGGQGCGGIFACVVNLLTKAAFDRAIDAAFVFFLLAVIFTAFALYLFVRLSSNELYKKHVIDTDADTSTAEEKPSNRDEEKLVQSDVLDASPRDDPGNLMTLKQFIQTTLWPYMLSVYLVFVVTLGLFPAVAAGAKPAGYDCHNPYHTKWFVALWCFTLFNVTDTAGRLMAGKINFPQSIEAMKLLALCLGRIVFLVIFPMCNIFPKEERVTDVVFESDIMYIVIMSLIGLSGGFLSAKAMTFAGQIAPKHLQDETGNLMGTCLVAGLLSGASLSFVVIALM